MRCCQECTDHIPSNLASSTATSLAEAVLFCAAATANRDRIGSNAIILLIGKILERVDWSLVVLIALVCITRGEVDPSSKEREVDDLRDSL